LTSVIDIDPSSVVSELTEFLGDAYVGPFVSIGFYGFQKSEFKADKLKNPSNLRATIIGGNARIFGSSVICSGCRIGSNFRADHHSYVGEHTILADDVVVEYGGRIYDRCNIGRGSFVGGFICNDVEVGEESVVQGALVHARRNLGSEPAPKIGSRCLVGTNSTIVGGVRMGDGSVLAAGSVLLSDAEPGHLYAGNPAVKIKKTTWH
jgi:acetyltransferase-like isoleucine patch superfamily enzyme